MIVYFVDFTDHKPFVPSVNIESVNLIDLSQPTTALLELEANLASEQTIGESYIVKCEIDYSLYPYNTEQEPIADEAEVRQGWRESSAFSDRFTALMTMTNKHIFDVESLDFLNKAQIIQALGELLKEQTFTGSTHTDLLHYTLVAQCAGDSDLDRCPSNIFENATKQVSDNGALWLLIANHAASIEDEQQVYAALEQLIAAPNYDEYWSDIAMLFEQAFSRIENSNRSMTIWSSVTLSNVMNLPDYAPLLNYCGAQSPQRADIAQLCLDSGLKQLHSSKSILSRAIAASQSLKIYELYGDQENSAAIKKIRKHIRDIPESNQLSQNLMFHDEQLLEYWFQSNLQFGELEAGKRVTEEAIRLSSDPNYNPCSAGKIQRIDENT